MKIIISGYGKMGREIEKIALQKGHEIFIIIDNIEDWEKNFIYIKNADVAIDFSVPETAVENIYKFFEAGIPVVSGTTGWNNQFNEVCKICNERNQTLFYSTNFNIGVNIFFALNRKLAEIMKLYTAYDVCVEETHHVQKLDSPSGTAIKLANDIINYSCKKEKWVNNQTEFNNFLEIKSHRIDNIFGIHNVLYTSDTDTIEIKHTAKNRSGFACGALMAAEWIQGRKGVFGMNNMLNL